MFQSFCQIHSQVTGLQLAWCWNAEKFLVYVFVLNVKQKWLVGNWGFLLAGLVSKGELVQILPDCCIMTRDQSRSAWVSYRWHISWCVFIQWSQWGSCFFFCYDGVIVKWKPEKRSFSAITSLDFFCHEIVDDDLYSHLASNLSLKSFFSHSNHRLSAVLPAGQRSGILNITSWYNKHLVAVCLSRPVFMKSHPQTGREKKAFLRQTSVKMIKSICPLQGQRLPPVGRVILKHFIDIMSYSGSF